MGSALSVRSATGDDAEGMLAIYAPVVTASPISFELEPPSVEEFRGRVEGVLPTHPWLVAEIAGEIVGYAYAGAHRNRPAYTWSVEVSVYVDPRFHRRGIARRLYSELFERLREQGFYNAFAGVTLPNEKSVAFHRSFGFESVGVYQKVGYKDGSWHDVAWFGRALREHGNEKPAPPAAPTRS